MKIAVCTGTRADWGLLLPLLEELKTRGVHIDVIASNMHLRHDLGYTLNELVADGFTPAVVIPTDGGAAEIAAAATSGHAAAFRQLRPDATLILGDRCEMLGAATAALLEGVPIIHIAGGTVSEGAFDDSIRHAITKMATLHLVETESCKARVVQMGENPANVVTTGAIGVWNVMQLPEIPLADLEESLDFRFTPRTVLATLHAATLDGGSPKERMRAMLDAFDRMLHLTADDCDGGFSAIITYPNNDVDPAPQIALLNEFEERWKPRVRVIPSLGRMRYATALRHASAVVGNSSGGIVEAPSAGIPTLDIGNRQKGRERAASVVECAADADSIFEGLQRVLSEDMCRLAARGENPYGRPDTPRLMADAILNHKFEPWPEKKFMKL